MQRMLRGVEASALAGWAEWATVRRRHRTLVQRSLQRLRLRTERAALLGWCTAAALWSSRRAVAVRALAKMQRRAVVMQCS